MAVGTTRLNLTKPGGGSTGLILPPDPVDIDVLNANFDKIDSVIGAQVVTSATRPATPFDGQIIYETDTKRVRVYRQTGAVWDTADPLRGNNTIYTAADLAALDVIADANAGDLAWVANPGTGITPMYFECLGGTAGLNRDWRPVGEIVAATKANLDSFITAMAAFAGTDMQFKIGQTALVTTGNRRFRFTSTAGAMDTLNTFFKGVFTASKIVTANTLWGRTGFSTFESTVDPDAAFAAATGLFTCPGAGRYLVTVQTKNNNTGIANIAIQVKKNGSAVAQSPNFTTGAFGGDKLVYVVECAKGDTLSVETTATYTTQADGYDNNWVEYLQVI